MGLHPHYLPDLILSALSISAIVAVGYLGDWRSRRTAYLLLGALALIVGFSGVLAVVRIARLFPSQLNLWVRCAGLFAGVGAVYALFLMIAFRSAVAFHPVRRSFLKAAAVAAVAAPTAVTAFAIVRREKLVFREIPIRLPSLPRELDGLRIVQVSDIHLSPFVSEALLERAVGMANDTQAHIAVVTGDMISMRGDPIDVCLRHLSRLKADAGVFGCMGNHEIYAGAVSYADKQSQRLGLRFLRSESIRLQFGGSRLNLAGVDYQRRERPFLVGAESLVVPGEFNVLLSHNPEVFPVASGMQFDLTLAGHTHGGQVNFEMIHPSLNIVNFTSNFVYGVYEDKGRAMYVTRGIGTIGLPARLGAPAEVALIRLCAI